MDRQQLQQQQLDRQMINLTIVGAGMAVSLLLYAGLAWGLLEVMGLDLGVALPAGIASLLAAIGVLLVVIAWPAEGFLRARGAGPRSDHGELLRAYSQAKIISFVLREAGGVLGLVVSLISGSATWSIVLSAIGLAGMAISWPRRHTLEDWVLQRPASVL